MWALAIGASLTLSGCGKTPASPDKTYRTFHESLTDYARQGHPGYRAQAFALLTRSSQERLAAAAKAVNASLPDGATPLEPDEMLQVGHLVVDEPIESVDYEEASDGWVRVRAKVGDVTSTVMMSFEDGRWRIELFDPPPTKDDP